MDADEIPSLSSQVEKIDTVARRTFGLDSPASCSGAVNLNVLSGERAVVQINQKNEQHQSKFVGVCLSFLRRLWLARWRENAPEEHDYRFFRAAHRPGTGGVAPFSTKAFG